MNPNDDRNGTRQFQEEWNRLFGVIKYGETKVFCCHCNVGISLRFFNIKRHFEKIHSNLASLSEEERQETNYKAVNGHVKQSIRFKNTCKADFNISEASFIVSHTIAVHGKPLSDGVYIKEAFKRCSGVLFAGFSNLGAIVKRIDDLPVSRNTIKSRILEMEKDVSKQLIEDIKKVETFSICLDESTDITSHARLSL